MIRLCRALIPWLLLAASCSDDTSSPTDADGDAAASSQGPLCTDDALEELPSTCPTTVACDDESSAPSQLRLVSWNVSAASHASIDAVIAQLHEVDADIVLLQELDVDVERSGVIDQPRRIAESLGYEYVFVPTLALEGGFYGIALFSRLPFNAVSKIALSNDGAAEPRAAIDARLCLGARSLRVINHHADYRARGAQASVLEVLDAIARDADLPVVFGGDLNAEPEAPGPLACVEAGLVDALALYAPRPTWNGRRIDYLFVDSAVRPWLAAADVREAEASDHRAIVLELSLE